MKKPLSKLERLPLREAWKDEANDFTPWLADVGYTALNARDFDNLAPRLISGQLHLHANQIQPEDASA